MSELIHKVNEADRIAKLWKEGAITALELTEQLAASGWFNINFHDNSVTACYTALHLRLGEDNVQAGANQG